jgi:hypothetical protein
MAYELETQVERELDKHDVVGLYGSAALVLVNSATISTRILRS